MVDPTAKAVARAFTATVVAYHADPYDWAGVYSVLSAELGAFVEWPARDDGECVLRAEVDPYGRARALGTLAHRTTGHTIASWVLLRDGGLLLAALGEHGEDVLAVWRAADEEAAVAVIETILGRRIRDVLDLANPAQRLATRC